MSDLISIIEEVSDENRNIHIIFFTEGDELYKTSISNNIFLEKRRNHKMEAHLRKLYDYHKHSTERVDRIELLSLLNFYKTSKNESKELLISTLIRNRKIDNVLDE